jgi:hypothetical protein
VPLEVDRCCLRRNAERCLNVGGPDTCWVLIDEFNDLARPVAQSRTGDPLVRGLAGSIQIHAVEEPSATVLVTDGVLSFTHIPSRHEQQALALLPLPGQDDDAVCGTGKAMCA